MEEKFRVLLVDDDSLIEQSFQRFLPKNWELTWTQNPKDLPQNTFFHAVFVDMFIASRSTPDGIAVIHKLSGLFPQTEIIAVSGDLRREIMEQTIGAGAQRFLMKPLMGEEVELALKKIEALWKLRFPKHRNSAWIGLSSLSQKVLREVAILKSESGPILLEGESGTGKEVVAKMLNEQETNRPFVSVNVAALTETLFESEMFGHVRGAFTGADQNRVGLCEAANGGDLFLDEIEALPLSLQPKFLRFLETGEFRKLGAKENQKSHCRIIAATNEKLETKVQKKEFREDLFFRLAGKRLKIAPLRDRTDDIALLAQFFLDQVRPQRKKKFTDDALQVLKKYSWPGNVRELKRLSEQMSLISPLPYIRSEDLSGWLQAQTLNSVPDFAKISELGLQDTLAQYEKNLISHVLKQEKEVEAAAKVLRVSKSNLYRKLKEYGIDE